MHGEVFIRMYRAIGDDGRMGKARFADRRTGKTAPKSLVPSPLCVPDSASLPAASARLIGPWSMSARAVVEQEGRACE